MIRIIDFAQAVKIDKENQDGGKITERTGTPYYIAPEVLNSNYGPKCDVWAIGVITFIMLSGTPPFNGSDDVEILKKVKKASYFFINPVWG